MKKFFLFFVGIPFLLWHCKPTEGGDTIDIDVAFVCEVIEGSDNLAASAVYAIINESKVKIGNLPGCFEIEKKDYEKFHIPNGALAATAGNTEKDLLCIYAVSTGGVIEIFKGQARLGKEKEGFNFFPLATYQNDRFSIKFPLNIDDLVGIYAVEEEDQSCLLFLGLRETTLDARFFEFNGPIPPTNQIIRYLPSLIPHPIDSFKVDFKNLSFQSSHGRGALRSEEQGLEISFFDFPGREGQPLVLKKLE